MKRILSLLLVLIMLMLTVVGCSNDNKAETPTETETGTEAAPTIGEAQGAIGKDDFTFPTLPEGEVTEPTDPEETLPPVELVELGNIPLSQEIKHNDLEYVMVYNPQIYRQFYEGNLPLSSGRIEDQIIVDMNRADGLGDIPDMIPVGQDELTDLTLSGDADDIRAELMGRSFRKGDVEEFYTYNSISMSAPRELRKFTCVYAGEYCNIWSYQNAISEADAKLCAEQFDTNIYNQMVEKFGEPRYESAVNFLYYPMQDNIGGCFCGLDLLTKQEIPMFNAQDLGVNTNVNLLHMSSKFDPLAENAISTLAHEFQHLICFTDTLGINFYSPCVTWINESMSGYVEEMLYPGVQLAAGRMDQYMSSNLIRYGQSLYNFATLNTLTEFDIGVYGSVYLYSMYLERLAGEDVFAKFHDYWRNTYSETLKETLSEAEVLANAVPEEIYLAVDQSMTYPTAIVFNNYLSDYEQWMSKLTLQFYLDMLDEDESDPVDSHNVDPEKLVYDQLQPALIEGGGRVILQLKTNTFKIPTFAGKGLIYVGLDKDFNVLTVCYN